MEISFYFAMGTSIFVAGSFIYLAYNNKKKLDSEN